MQKLNQESERKQMCSLFWYNCIFRAFWEAITQHKSTLNSWKSVLTFH